MLKPISQIDRGGKSPAVELFAYSPVAVPVLPSWEEFGITLDPRGTIATGAVNQDEAQNRCESWQAQLDAERRRSFELGRERGFQEGRTAERDALSDELETRTSDHAAQITRLVHEFHAEKARYFETVETEVVKLALAVAARILRREAQMDPLLLSGAVRVALGQLSSSTEVRLRVPPADLELWTEAIAHLPNLPVKPAVVAGQDMQLGDCMLEAELGSVDLGVAAQLSEIERGFFDRVGRNTDVVPALQIAEEMSE